MTFVLTNIGSQDIRKIIAGFSSEDFLKPQKKTISTIITYSQKKPGERNWFDTNFSLIGES